MSSKFKIGDEVIRIAGGEWLGMDAGDVGTIKSINSNNQWSILEFEEEEYCGIYSDFNFKLKSEFDKNPVPYVTSKGNIVISEWVLDGDLMVHRDALDWSDPHHKYNVIKDKLKLVPEDYGIKHPLYSEFDSQSRSELIEEIISLRQQVTGLARSGLL